MVEVGDEVGGGWLRLRRAALLGAVAMSVTAPAGWLVTDRLERDNDFCVSCHLAPGVPLHEAKHEDLGARPPATLAAAHGAAGVSGGEGARAFRCIDCHGGTGAIGRLRVKVLSARDAFWYVVGRFEEPDVMHWPLLDADCRKCHPTFEERDVTPGLDPRFHELAVHNVSLAVSCVACHLAHDEGGLADRDFLHPEPVRAQCGACHPAFLELAREPSARARIPTRGRNDMRRCLAWLGAALLVSPAAFAYPGGTPSYQTDAAPFCASCHSSRSVEMLDGAGDFATQQLAENNHYALIREGSGGYESLSPEQRATLIQQLRDVDANSTVRIEAPASVAAGATFQVKAILHGGAGPAIGVGLVDAAHRWLARPAPSAGWQVVGAPVIRGADGAAQVEWLERRPDALGRNLSFVNVTGVSSNAETGEWASAEVTWTLRAPAQAGPHPLAASFWYGTEKATSLGYTTDPIRGKQVRGGFGGHSGRVQFTDVLTVEVR